jgi:CRP-like cAMP-binding protein
MFMRVSELAESFSPAELEKRAQQLSKIDIFENVTLANLENLSRAIKVEEFPAEHILFREGDEGDSMYMIEEGSLHIFVSENGQGENILRTFHKGQVVGEFSLLDGQPRSASARAYEDVRALVLSRQMFMMFIQSRPQVILAMLEYLSQKVRYTTQAVQAATEMAQKIADGDYESIRQSVMEISGGKEADDSASIVRKAFASLIKALENRESSFVSVPQKKQPPRKTMHDTLTQKITERSESQERVSGLDLHSRIGDRLDERRIDIHASKLPTSGSVAEWLRSYEDSIFSSVELSDLESLISMMENRHYEEGAVLFKEGDPGDSMYIILSGVIRVYINDERGRERDIRQFQKGEFFGEFAFLDQQPRSASAAAIEPLDVLILDREKFTRFIEENPPVIFAMMRSLAYRIIGSDGPGQTLESIFEGADPSEIAPLHAEMETISLERGDIVFEQDAKADAFYLIEQGTVSTYIAYPDTKPIEDSTFVAGQIFGEIATFAESSYSMTAIAADHVELRVLLRDDFCDFLKMQPKMGMIVMKNLVARVRSTYKHLESISNVFRGMAWNDLKLLDEVMVSRTYAKGELLFEEGDPGDSMYIIKSGRIRIFLPDGKGGPLTLRYYGPNEVFGELALIDSRPRSASADVADALEVRVLYREDFHMLIHKRPSVGLAMIRNLTDRVRYTTNFLEKVLDWTEKASQGNFEEVKLSMREIDQQGQIGGLLQAFSDMINSLQASGSEQSHQN